MRATGYGFRKPRAKKAVASAPWHVRKELKPQTSRHTPEADIGKSQEEGPATFLKTTQTEPLRFLSSNRQPSGPSVHSHV